MNRSLDNKMLRLTACLCALAAALLAGCSKPAAPTKPAAKPRIVTFSPALTSMAFDMGLGDHVVGVTSQCRLPDNEKRPIVGDSYSVNSEAIASVEPDIVMIQQLPEKFEPVKKLKPGVRIEHFTIETLDDVANALERIGKLAGDEKRGREMSEQFRSVLNASREAAKDLPRPKVLFLIAYQYDKPGTGGKSSFIHEMIEIAGGTDAASGYERWADLDASAVLSIQPDVLIVWTQAGAEEQARNYWTSLKGLNLPKEKVFVVSDPNWTIPSARLCELTVQLELMIHPELAEITDHLKRLHARQASTSQRTTAAASQGDK